jgi:hypothetical protein
VVWCGDIADGMRAIAPLRATGTPLADVVRPVPYRSVQTLLDGAAPAGTRAFWRSLRFADLDAAVIDEIASLVESVTSPMSLISGWAIGGAVSRVDPASTAIGERPPGFEVRLIGQWPPTDPDGERHIAWVKDGWETLRPHSTGRQYPGQLSDEGIAGVRAAYGDHFHRLVALKERWDPTNVFRHNANIPPKANGQSR